MNPLLVSWTNTPSISLRPKRPHIAPLLSLRLSPSRPTLQSAQLGLQRATAALDHRGQAESVKIIVQILLTDSYPAYIPRPTGSRSGSPTGFAPRPYNFWKDLMFRSSAKTANSDPLLLRRAQLPLFRRRWLHAHWRHHSVRVSRGILRFRFRTFQVTPRRRPRLTGLQPHSPPLKSLKAHSSSAKRIPIANCAPLRLKI